ncbi:MAG: hypothetical protein M3Y71_03815 [Actinomycetota bacterium]|nr:hypothetical protein [Actinomycetota bacterium]
MDDDTPVPAPPPDLFEALRIAEENAANPEEASRLRALRRSLMSPVLPSPSQAVAAFTQVSVLGIGGTPRRPSAGMSQESVLKISVGSALGGLEFSGVAQGVSGPVDVIPMSESQLRLLQESIREWADTVKACGTAGQELAKFVLSAITAVVAWKAASGR